MSSGSSFGLLLRHTSCLPLMCPYRNSYIFVMVYFKLFCLYYDRTVEQRQELNGEESREQNQNSNSLNVMNNHVTLIALVM